MAVAAVALTAAAQDFSYTANPAPGVVDQLNKITITFGNLNEVDINDSEGIFVMEKNNGEVQGVEVGTSGKNGISVTFGTPVTTPGTYTVFIGAGVLAGYGDYDYDNDEYTWADDNTEAIILDYTIEGSAEALDFTYESSLSTDGFLAYFGELTLTFPNLDSVSCESDGVEVTFNGEPQEGTVSADANKLTITLKEALNFKDGTVVVTIAAEALEGNANGTTANNAAPISLTYNMATPVEQNLELAISTPKPNDKGEISANKSLESIFFVCEQKGLVAAAGTEPNVTVKEVNGDYEVKARLRKSGGLNQNYTYFAAQLGNEPAYNGEYTITIEKGAFGTEAWLADPNYGQTNNEIVLTFTLVDGADYAKYTIEPESVTPEAGTYKKAADIATVTVKFAEGVELVEGGAATLAGVDNSYAETAKFSKVDGGYAVTFETLPTEDGKYTFTVLQGTFGDAGFVAEGKGKASKPITVEYTLSLDVSVASINAAKESVVYNLQGQKLNATPDHLPAGLYIVDGKKVMVGK